MNQHCAGFFRALTEANEWLDHEERRLLLTVDEYEFLDTKIGEGVFSTDLLAMVRESIQTHRRIIWMFAGSHHVSEPCIAPWSSYLVQCPYGGSANVYSRGDTIIAD